MNDNYWPYRVETCIKWRAGNKGRYSYYVHTHIIVTTSHREACERAKRSLDSSAIILGQACQGMARDVPYHTGVEKVRSAAEAKMRSARMRAVDSLERIPLIAAASPEYWANRIKEHEHHE